MISVTELPDDFTRICSGTGDASPKNMVVTPLIFEGALQGVIELGGFSEFSPKIINFLTSVSDAISVGINSAQGRLQIVETLEKTKEQATILQAQQEELETANELLEQKTANLQEQNLRIELANAELETTRKEIEQKAEELERRVDERTDELQQSFEAAQAASRSKSDFLANMSHEIRTPMTAILGFTEIVRDNVKDPENRDWLDKIQRNGDHLLGVINDILDISKIEANKLDVETIDVSPSQIIADVTSLTSVRASGKGLAIKVEIDGPIPQTIKTDPTRLRQILVNLMGNAIKFTDFGEVRLVARVLDADPDEPKMEFDVVDTGIGLNDEQMGNLFQPFVQADTSTTRKYGGTGLGLTISKRLSNMLGGDISVHSVLGEGSTFSVRVSAGLLNGVKMLDRPTDIDKPAKTDSESEGKNIRLDCRVLLAEDGPDNQRLISFILEKAGANVTIAENGQIAVDLALEARDTGSPFDVILMDMQMPVLDGYGATGKLREAGYTGPILALTAHAMNSDRDKCIDAGCDDYTTKPINRKLLISMVGQYASQQTSSEVLHVDG